MGYFVSEKKTFNGFQQIMNAGLVLTVEKGIIFVLFVVKELRS